MHTRIFSLAAIAMTLFALGSATPVFDAREVKLVTSGAHGNVSCVCPCSIRECDVSRQSREVDVFTSQGRRDESLLLSLNVLVQSSAIRSLCVVSEMVSMLTF